jgi:hypothetical protein
VYQKAGQGLAEVSFHFLPMPTMLRRSGSFGTHFMMQERIAVCEDHTCKREIELTGVDAVLILRNLGLEKLPDEATPAAKIVHATIRRGDGTHTQAWTRMVSRLR